MSDGLRLLAFEPATNYTVAVTGTTQSTSVDPNRTAYRIVVKPGSAVGVFVSASIGAQAVSSSNGMYLPVGAIEVLAKGNADRINLIGDGGTATVYLTVGEGV
mgnify:CR=1 FL=1